MILTVTLNPAVDKTYTLSNLVPGNVNRVETMVNLPGGKGINVARIAQQLGAEVTATGFLGGYSGRFIQDELEGSLNCSFVPIEGESRSSINILGKDGYVTEVLEPGPVISDREWQTFLKHYSELASEADIIVLSGSLAGGIPQDAYRVLIEMAKKQEKKVLLDTSMEALREGIAGLPYLIKPNRKELEYLMGRRLDSGEKLLEAGHYLQEKGIANVMISMGDKGFYFLGSGQAFLVRPPKIKAMNTVGCGDSLVAVVAMGIERREGLEAILRRASAVSAANAVTVESGIIPVEFIKGLEQEVKIIRLEGPPQT